MKLFQKLLLAPTAIGLFAPITASASEANLMDVSNYSQVDVEVTQDTFKPLSTKNPLLAGGEGLGQDLSNDFDGDTFSSTTSATFASNWAIGSVDGTANANNEKVATTFDWSLSTITSFTGNDSLDVTIKGGSGDVVLTELDFFASGRAADGDQDEILNVDSISYTSSVGDYLTYFFGFGTDGSLLYNTACAYEAQTEVFSSCGLTQVGLDAGYGTNFGATIDVGNGIFVSVGYEGEGTSAAALMSEEGGDHLGGQVAYIQDNWGVSLSASTRDYASQAKLGSTINTVQDATAINGFFIPSLDGFPSISFGYEWSHAVFEGHTDQTDNATNYFVGFQFDDLGNGTLGVAVGSKALVQENQDAETMWEAYYAYNYADGITITPLVYVKEEADQGVDDETGIILKTSFEF